MFVDYIILGLISLITLIWTFSTLPENGASDDDNEGGRRVGGDTYPTETPPSIVREDATEKSTSSAGPATQACG